MSITEKMKNNDNRYKKIAAICKILYFILPIPVTWFSLSLMSTYMKYYDIGVNSGANNGFLIMIVAPILLAALYAIALSIYFLSVFLKKYQYRAMALGSFLIIICGFSAFLFNIQSTKDYPTEKPQDTTLFLKYYFWESKGE